MWMFRAIMVGLLCTSVFLSGCSNEPDCLTSDTLREVETVEDTRHLYLRVSGFQEKEFFYELYDQEPSFDSCGVANIETVAVAHIDREQGVPSAIDVKEASIEILYSEDGTFSEAGLTNVTVNMK